MPLQEKDGRLFEQMVSDMAYESQSSGRYERMKPAQELVRHVLRELHKKNIMGESLRDRFGVSANTFRLYTSGAERMSPKFLVQICDMLEVTPDKFHALGDNVPARSEIVEAAVAYAAEVGADKVPESLFKFLKAQMELVNVLGAQSLPNMPEHFERLKQINDIVREYLPLNTYGVHWMRDIGDVRQGVLDNVEFVTKGTWLRDGLDKYWGAQEDKAARYVTNRALLLFGAENAEGWSNAFLAQAKAMGFEAAEMIARIEPEAIHPLDKSRWQGVEVDNFFKSYRQWWDVKIAQHKQRELRNRKPEKIKLLFGLRQWAASASAQDYLDAEINARYIEEHTKFTRERIKHVFAPDDGAVKMFMKPSKRMDAWQKMYGHL